MATRVQDAVQPTPPLLAPHSAVTQYLSRLKASSRRTQQVALDRVAALLSDGRSAAANFAWHHLTEQQTQTVRQELAARYAPSTANRMIAALRGVLKEAWRLGLMDAESYHRASTLRNVPWSTPPRGRTLSDDELWALFDACSQDQSPAGARDAALLTVLYGAGLGRSEATALDLCDYDASSGAVAIRGTTHGRERTLYAVDSAAEALDRWISIRGTAPGPLFVPIDKAGKVLIRDERMRDQSIYRALLKRAEQAGIAAVSCQDLRRTFITRLLEAGANISTVQRLAGHCSVTTTQRYDRRSETFHRESASMLAVPEHEPFAPASGATAVECS